MTPTSPLTLRPGEGERPTMMTLAIMVWTTTMMLARPCFLHLLRALPAGGGSPHKPLLVPHRPLGNVFSPYTPFLTE